VFERMLLPLDGSAAAEAALPVARLLAGPAAEVILLRAVGPAVTDVHVSFDPQGAVEEARAYLSAVQTRLGVRGVAVRSCAVAGDPGPAILAAVERERATLVAMSTHGRTGLSRLVFGSVAEGVVRASRVPVLLVRAGAPVPAGVRRVLVPLDGSARSARILDPAMALSRVFGAHLLLFHVFPRGPGPGDPQMPLREACAALDRAALPYDAEFFSGDPADEIGKAVREFSIDLVAMATHGRTGLARAVLGSVTEAVLRHASCPMLVLRSAGGPS
jgi:nucleotide-binding universal stress UspA family protein